MTTEEFNRLLRMAAGWHNLPLKETYVEFTWWEDKFLPLIMTDRDAAKSEFTLVFGQTPCNFWRRHVGSHECSRVPCGFYVEADQVRPEDVVHRPLTLDYLVDREWMLDMKTVRFLFANSPVNYSVNVNPFRTRVYRNWALETVLCLYASDGGHEAKAPFSRMRPERICLIDDRPKIPDGNAPEGDAK